MTHSQFAPPALLPSHYPGPQPPLCFPEGMVPTAMLALHPCPHPALSCSGRYVLPTFLFHPSSPTSTSQLSTCPYTLQSTSTATLGTSVCQALSWEGPIPGERPHSLRPPSDTGSHLQVRGSSTLSGGVAPTLRPWASHPICAPPLQLTSHRAAVTIHSTASPAGWAPTCPAADAALRKKCRSSSTGLACKDTARGQEGCTGPGAQLPQQQLSPPLPPSRQAPPGKKVTQSVMGAQLLYQGPLHRPAWA